MKILLGAHATVLGGAAFVLLDTVRALQARYEVQVVMPAADGPLYPELAGLGVKIHILPRRQWIPFPRAPFEGEDVNALQQLLSDENIGLAITNTAVVASLALAAARSRIPHIWYIHEALATNIDVYPVIGPARCFMTIVGLSTRVLTSSRNVKQEFMEYLPPGTKADCEESSKVNVLYPALRDGFVRDRIDHPQKFERFTALCCGAQSFNKGTDQLVLAADRIRREIPSFQLILVGMRGDASAFIADTIARLRLEDTVRLRPHVDNLQDLVPQAHLAIYPSKRESFGLSMLEAAASGIPVLATRSGGSEEVLAHTPATVWLASVTEDEICKKVLELHDCYDESAKLARRSAPEIAAEFSYERFKNRLLGHVDEASQSASMQTARPHFRVMEDPLLHEDSSSRADAQHAGEQREMAQYILREVYRYCFDHKSGFEDCSMLVVNDDAGDYILNFAAAGLDVLFAELPEPASNKMVARRIFSRAGIADRIVVIHHARDCQRLVDFVLCLPGYGCKVLPDILSGLEAGSLVFLSDIPGARDLEGDSRFSMRSRMGRVHCWEKL